MCLGGWHKTVQGGGRELEGGGGGPGKWHRIAQRGRAGGRGGRGCAWEG